MSENTYDKMHTNRLNIVSSVAKQVQYNLVLTKHIHCYRHNDSVKINLSWLILIMCTYNWKHVSLLKLFQFNLIKTSLHRSRNKYQQCWWERCVMVSRYTFLHSMSLVLTDWTVCYHINNILYTIAIPTRRDGQVSWASVSCFGRSEDSNPQVSVRVQNWYLLLHSQVLGIIRTGKGLVGSVSACDKVWCWQSDLPMGQHYKVTISTHFQKSAPILICSWYDLRCC